MSQPVEENSPAQMALGCAVMVGLTIWVGSCVFGHSEAPQAAPTPRPPAAAASAPAQTEDAAYLAADPGLKKAHDMDGSGDGFREIISMKDSDCWKTISITKMKKHRYRIICSHGESAGRVNFSAYMVDTETGFTMRTD